MSACLPLLRENMPIFALSVSYYQSTVYGHLMRSTVYGHPMNTPCVLCRHVHSLQSWLLITLLIGSIEMIILISTIGEDIRYDDDSQSIELVLLISLRMCIC